MNNLIRPFLNKEYIVSSSDELLVHLNQIQLTPEQKLMSLDVESLFTNVPVNCTIDIIIHHAYNHPTLPPPPLLQRDMEALLKICTQETPFLFDDKTFIQTDGVSMGSPLGPTFADFYMSEVENLLLSQNRVSNPVKYLRYVDDTLVIFNSRNHARYFIQRLKNNSVLKFTKEEMVGSKFHFLDVNMDIGSDGCIQTSVFIKPTDNGLYTNFASYTPKSYKTSIIKTLVNRAIKHSSTWIACHSELDRIRQIMANNMYPQALCDQIIQRKLDNHFNEDPSTEIVPVNLYVQLFNLSTYKQDSCTLKKVLEDHVLAARPNHRVMLKPYFKPRKISSQFSCRPVRANLDSANVVYQFNCQEVSCNATYIGHTSKTLRSRIKQHRYSASSIYQHFINDHNELPPQFDVLSNQFEIVFNSTEILNVKIAEAILIKSKNPYINVKYNELYDFLKLF